MTRLRALAHGLAVTLTFPALILVALLEARAWAREQRRDDDAARQAHDDLHRRRGP